MATTRVVLLAQREPLFMPIIFRELAEGLANRLVAAGFLSRAVSWKAFRREYLDRLFYYGWLDFSRIAFLYAWKQGTQLSLEGMARRYQVPLIRGKSSSLKDPTLLERLNGYQPDLLLTLGNQIVPREVLALAKHGCFNIHLALLPRHRGREPVLQAVLARDAQVGVTVHKMTDQLDAGDIYAQRSFTLDMTKPVLKTMEDLWKVGARLFCQVAAEWDANVPEGRAQDASQATYHSFPTAAEVQRFRRQGGRFL